eukprot:CAMPEP_0183347206 /NCGR_PEP_ID=MMETSP0164_2-20130417/12100_1 /TAXON_ID=221442 /ORGANISM="Coccolithus pelagicus ssp braarudi, Strain PLY182g" /LENGTH=334 /DNA_ID=CAMNT_0025518595 /DNA_START=13 /DNA_END=1017 /DNA_ORIENTATION=-
MGVWFAAVSLGLNPLTLTPSPQMAVYCHPQPLSVAAWSICPADLWHDRIAPLLVESKVVMLNIGANKGYNLLEFAQRYSPASSNLTHQAWYSQLVKLGCQAQCCGVCRKCKAANAKLRQAANAPLSMHAFELQPANANLLREMVRMFALPVEVHQAAVSNFSGTVYASSSVRPGSESFGLARTPSSKSSVALPVTTVDAFMEENEIERAHFVSIDAEGEDPLVMFGMAKMLAARRVDIVEFEYNRKWKLTLREPRPMRPVAEWLHRQGYVCFWQGDNGALAQLSPPCYVEETHNRFGFARGNAVCSHRADIIAVLQGCKTRTSCSTKSPGTRTQ